MNVCLFLRFLQETGIIHGMIESTCQNISHCCIGSSRLILPSQKHVDGSRFTEGEKPHKKEQVTKQFQQQNKAKIR